MSCAGRGAAEIFALHSRNPEVSKRIAAFLQFRTDSTKEMFVGIRMWKVLEASVQNQSVRRNFALLRKGLVCRLVAVKS